MSYRVPFFLILFIHLFGLIMIFSSSYIYAREYFGSGHFFFTRQIIFSCLASLTFYFFSKVSFNFIKKFFFISHLCVLFLLILTFIFPHAQKGSFRWLHFHGYSLQPGEFLKLSTILGLYWLLEKKRHIVYWLIYCIPFLLLLKQPDFGTFILCLISIFVYLFLYKFTLKKTIYVLLGSIPFVVYLIIKEPYRLNRILSFLNPWKDPLGKGFQVIQSFLAFAKGGFFGVGLGNSYEKLFYLPEAHNDFLFSVLGEELGFLGVFIFVTTYYLFFFLLKDFINKSSEPIFGFVLLFTLILQAFINMSVCLGILPTKGITLPFFSYGGSSLLVSSMVLGILYGLCKKT